MFFRGFAAIALLFALTQGAAVPAPDSIEVAPANERTDIFTASDGKNYTVYIYDSPDSHPAAAIPGVTKRDQYAGFTPDGAPIDWCGSTSWRDETTGGSPFTNDCGCVRDYSNSHNGYWLFNTAQRGQWFRMLRCGSCQFRALTPDFTTIGVGNTDIRDLVGDAIKRYDRGGRTGASGDMPCLGQFTNTNRVTWALYRVGS